MNDEFYYTIGVPLLVLFLVLMSSGCGGWQSIHAPIGTALVDASIGGEATLREARIEAMRTAGAAAQAEADPIPEDVSLEEQEALQERINRVVIAAVDAAAAPFECPIAAFNIFAGRVNRYARELLAALAEDREPNSSQVVLDLQLGYEGYAIAQACTDLDLPAIPALPEGWL